MRIAILADPIDNQKAGIHIYAKELVKAIDSANPDHEFILIREKKDPSIKNLKQVTVPNTRLPIGFATFRLLFIIPMMCRKLKVDAVWELAHFGPFNLPKRIKRITSIHDLTPILFPEYHRWHSQTLQRIFLKKITRKASLIITNSDNTLKDLIQFNPAAKGKSVRIYLGKEVLFKNQESRLILDKYGIHHPYFFYTGTIEPRKNLLTLLEAYKRFRENSKQTHSLIIAGGKGWRSGKFYEALDSHPYKSSIRLLGYVDRSDLPALYSGCLAFIYPSLYEGFGLPVLEAMSCGAPCIVADNSSLPEVGGEAAVYFNTNDAADLQKSMELISRSDDRESLQQKSIQRSGNFSWAGYVQQIIKEINSLFLINP